MQINEILRPCPFCGAEVRDVSFEADGLGISRLMIRCFCGADITIEADDVFYSNMDRFRPGLNAVEKWNRRDGNAAQNETMEG